MYIKIRTNRNIAHSLQYHEQKVDRKQAQCIVAENFLKDLPELSRHDKLSHFQRLTSLNERVEKNTIHLSINFHASESVTNDRMSLISKEYMSGIGLADQPYLVYRHDDARHPHCHVLCPKIDEEGNRIDLHEVTLKKSLRVSRELEAKYDLVALQKRSEKRRPEDESTVQKIEDAVRLFVPSYKYTNLGELNALLSIRQVEAYRGREESTLYQKGGLIYRVIDDNGRRISAPIKASELEGKPTLKHLEERFATNLVQREEHRKRITLAIDWAFYEQRLSYEEFRDQLRSENVRMIDTRDDSRKVQRIWYVDLMNKVVWDAESLGQKYGANGIHERCISDDEYRQRQKDEQALTYRQRQRHC